MPGTAAAAGGSGPSPTSQAPTALYASLAWFRTCAAYTSDAPSSPSTETTISITTDNRSCCATSDVRSVDSRSGSIGKITAGVYTDVVFCAAWRSTGDPLGTAASTSAIATNSFTAPPATGSA